MCAATELLSDVVGEGSDVEAFAAHDLERDVGKMDVEDAG